MSDAQPLTQASVIGTATPPQGGIKADERGQVGDRNPGTLEGEGNEEMIPGWEILKGLFRGESINGFNNLARLAMLWIVYHGWYRDAQFPFNWYRHIIQLLVILPGEVDLESLLIK